MGDQIEQHAPRLSARGLIASRSGRRVVDIPSLDLFPGEVLAVVGPNGAGKTTLVMHLALLERPDVGFVLIDGEQSRGRELSLRRRMAVVFQEPLLLDRTVRANIEVGLRLRGTGNRCGRAQHWMERFGIAKLADRSARTLSGGEAQRTSLARAFALDPEVLFLDEPFSALDTPTRAAITETLAAVLTETRTTTVLVTHDHDEAARLGDRVAVLISGQLRQIGSPADVFGAPADELVAAFVGIETMVEGTVTERDAGLVQLNTAGQVIEVSDQRVFERALVCLRPEDISIALDGAAERDMQSARNALRGNVTRITLTGGGDARVEIDCGFPLRARVTRRSIEELGLEAGSNVVATFKATAVHLIPK
jgi:tungstate transport system ATP-binding protein